MSFLSAQTCKDFDLQTQAAIGSFYLKLEDSISIVTTDLRSQRINELSNNVENTKEQIDKAFNDLTEKLNHRRQQLLSETNAIHQSKKQQLQQQSKKDIKIQKELQLVKNQLRKILLNKNMNSNGKSNEIQKLLSNTMSKRKDLYPAIDDPTLTLVSFRYNLDMNVEVMNRNISAFGMIDNEEEKTVENLREHFKLSNGMLNITVVCAMNLLAADRNGKSDPFCDIRIFSDICQKNNSKTQKTKVVKKNCNPVWNEKFTFVVNDAVNDKLLLNVFDWDRMKTNDKIGELVFPVINVLKNGGFIERNFHFTKNKYPGTVQLVMEYSE